VNTDYDAIRAQIESMCKLEVTFGLPTPQAGYKPRRNDPKSPQPTILRYTVPVTVGGFSTTYSYPVNGNAYYGSAIHRSGVDMGGEWVAVPPRSSLPKVGDVLSSLLQDAHSGTDTFADFCSNFIYDTDSRKAFDVYLACQAALMAMQRAFGPDLGAACELAYQL
jgi:hypothetical protein